MRIFKTILKVIIVIPFLHLKPCMGLTYTRYVNLKPLPENGLLYVIIKITGKSKSELIKNKIEIDDYFLR
jgi:hypothetical protein